MMARMWCGWTTPENADRYEQLLHEQIFPAIAAKRLIGYRGIHLLRRWVGIEVEFTTIMWFDSLDAVRRFAGEAYEKAYVPNEAQAVLSRFDERSRHYDVVTRT
ncbi:MAG: hypothetical protein WD934_00355 [Gemmatimonadales bacterium]